MNESRSRNQRLASRWFGWEWWKSKDGKSYAFVPPPIGKMFREWSDRQQCTLDDAENLRNALCDGPDFSSNANAAIDLLNAVAAAGHSPEITRHGTVWKCTIVGPYTSGILETAESTKIQEAIAQAVDKLPPGDLDSL